MSSSPHRSHILIVGGGFAGIATVLRLIKDATHPLHLTVAEPRAQLGLGIAYGTTDPDHLLNGPAGMFSVYDDDPLHFSNWLQARAWTGGWQPPAGTAFEDSLAPRHVYGSYVRETLGQALARARGTVVLEHRRSRVVRLSEADGGAGYRADFADGGSIDAAQVVLAIGIAGRHARHLPFDLDPALVDAPGWVADIWDESAWSKVEEDRAIVFLGAGLSALDALISAEKAGFEGRYLTLSRSGLETSAREQVTPWQDFLRYRAGDVDTDIDLVDLLRQIRAQRRAIAEAGESWQRIVPAIRVHVPALWRAASDRTRARFLRRLRPFWEAALHRSAASPLEWRRRVAAEGRLDHHAAKIIAATRQRDGRIAVRFRRRGGVDDEVVVADRVVNCLGFEFDWRRIDDPLISSLLEAGWIAPHSSGFGIQADLERFAVIDAEGKVRSGLHAVGHPLRGVVWESNAISEQVPQAGVVGRAILAALSPLAQARRLSAVFQARAGDADRNGELVRQNLADAHAAGLTALAVPRRYGGLEQDIRDVVPVIGELGRGDPSTALIVLMQTFHHRWILASAHWPEALRETVLRGAAERGELINALRVEPEQGSPVRGGLPATVARRSEGGWRLTGRKLYSTGSEALTWGLVWAATDETPPRVGEFLVPMATEGVRIEQTWDHLGLRASGSHDVYFEDAWIPEANGVDLRPLAQWSATGDELGAWLPLMLAGLYDGVARAARDWLVEWIKQRRPSNLGDSLATLPRFRAAVGEIDALLQANQALLRQGVSPQEARGSRAALVKYTVTRQAISAVDKALALTGNHGLVRRNPLERYFRDVLCSRVHHPQDDLILEGAGRVAFS
ncbi:FAD/NAD(P)-binding protein [Variovorax sp. J22P168]|uniref:FAD/NAD(P)-binding protein n=1 Tax=Variovorax jilinensis TaxID=3053513 RepID=UPI0025773D77|nr:FAD/NAD(P)-binding protein [Variovorax sp. J22P168]MDM0014693.1 FAD/NAD(P)-binding protein [Variovorax sp. J22P168]